jgi:uncharacterized protein YndB with AHSA1/START domain
MKQKPYVVETTIHAPLETVWRALTDLDLIREWFGWDHDDLDGEIRFIFVDHAQLAPPDRIVFANDQELRLEPRGDRTVVRITMAGGLGGADWDDVYDGMEEGWRSFFEQLRFLLERRPAGRRRTVYRTGKGEPPAVEGEPWHSSRWQRITVDEHGHLVAVGWNDAGEVGVTVSTYGLDDAAFAAVRDRWTARVP